MAGDYENGLDMELYEAFMHFLTQSEAAYEVPLSMGYAGYTFHDAFEEDVQNSMGSQMIRA